MVTLTRLDSAQPDFQARLSRLLQFDDAADAAIEQTVAAILHDVKTRGDAAVLEYTERFDRLPATSLASLELDAAQLQAALDHLPSDTRQALEAAAERVRRYHAKQVQESWSYTEDDGTVLGQKITALDRVGLYVPGGKAAYPSSVLMNAIPAKVAGVGELIMVVPTPGGEQNQLVLAAAAIAGVDRVFTIGGAQAVAALAYGTADRAAGRQDRRPRQRLRGGGQAPRVRHRGHRHDRGAVRNPGDRRWQHACGMGGDGPVFAGRARRNGAVDPAVARRGLSRCRARRRSTS